MVTLKGWGGEEMERGKERWGGDEGKEEEREIKRERDERENERTPEEEGAGRRMIISHSIREHTNTYQPPSTDTHTHTHVHT